MDEVRVLLIDLPRMLREVVKNILDAHPGVTVAAVHPDPVSIVKVVDDARADLVVLGQGPELAAAGRTLLEQRPRVQLVALSDDARRATVSGLRHYRQPLGEVGPDRLVETIREAVAAAAVW